MYKAPNLDQAKRVQLVCKVQARQWCFCQFGIIKHPLWKQETVWVALWLWARQVRLCSLVIKRENGKCLVEHLPVIVRKTMEFSSEGFVCRLCFGLGLFLIL